MSIKVSKWNIAVLHSGLEPRGDSGTQHTHARTHDTHLRCEVSAIAAESNPSIHDRVFLQKSFAGDADGKASDRT